MNTTETIVLGLIVIALIAVAVALYMRARTTQHLRSQFGPEYGRTVIETGGQRAAETQLHEREKRVHDYGLKPLTATERDRFSGDWRRVQAKFVDDPKAAADEADNLLGQVMTARGYPDGDFQQRLEDLSVNHASEVQNYRAAHATALKHAKGEAGTEDMRQALIHYRALFDELVGVPAEPERREPVSSQPNR